MLRMFSLLGLGSGFLMISPKLRDGLLQQFTQGLASLDEYSPYSYVALALVILGGLMLSLIRSSAPR